jgi:CRP/FNR family transcriptional regulator, cyclic AMP receptor protein
MTTKKTKDPVILERRFVPQGSIIMREGEKGYCAFLIQSGKVRVYAGENRVELATMDMGQIFGEMALVFDEPRTATVEALEDCNLIVITRDTLQQKLERSDPTVRAIVPMLMKRIVQANNVLLNKQGDGVDDMIETVNSIYQNIHASLPPVQKKSLETAVLPPLEVFLKAVQAFKARYNG